MIAKKSVITLFSEIKSFSEISLKKSGSHADGISLAAKSRYDQAGMTPESGPSAVSSELLRYTFGLKVRTLRRQQRLGLKDLAARSGVSVSYLSEIEKGLKYPKPGKILSLASALGVSFDDLVSSKVDDELDPLKALASSPLLRGFPFELFGLQAQDLLSLVTDVPDKAGALVRALVDVGRTYDVRVEHFLFAALRSYQQMNHNHFPEIEAAAAAFRRELGLGDKPSAMAAGLAEALRRVLETDWGCQVDDERIPATPALAGLRSVWVEDGHPNLLINGRLLPEQKAFLFGREIGYRRLELRERSASSSPVSALSFDQAINDFQAAYFAGAVLIPEADLVTQVKRLFGRKRWSADAFTALLARYRATPETLFYRLSQILPGRFGLEKLFFLRFNHTPATGVVRLSKYLNMSPVPVPYGIGTGEHYCRRWPALVSLLGLAEDVPSGPLPAGPLPAGPPTVVTRRAAFGHEHGSYWVLSLARPLTLAAGTNASVSLGFPIDDALRETVSFVADPAIEECRVGLTCERCSMANCAERAAPPSLHEQASARADRAEALDSLFADVRPAPRSGDAES